MSLHRYIYVGNSPVNYWDWYGYEICAFGYCQSDLQEDVSNTWNNSVETFNEIKNVYNEKKDQIYAEVENEVNQFIGHAGGGLETVVQFVHNPQSVVGQIDLIQLVNGEYDPTLHARLVTQSNINKWTQFGFGDEALTVCSLGVTFIPGIGDYIDTAFATDEIINGDSNAFTYLSFTPFIPSKLDDAWDAGRKLLSRSDDGGGVINKIDDIAGYVDDIPYSNIPKPTVNNQSLQYIIDDLYKGANSATVYGSGSTADAIRKEIITGKETYKVFHSQKGEEYVKALENWLRKNPDADKSDIEAAQLVLNDLNDALATAK